MEQVDHGIARFLTRQVVVRADSPLRNPHAVAHAKPQGPHGTPHSGPLFGQVQRGQAQPLHAQQCQVHLPLGNHLLCHDFSARLQGHDRESLCIRQEMGIGQHIPRFIYDKATSFRRESVAIMSTHPHNAFYLRPSRTREQEHHKLHHHSNDTHGDSLPLLLLFFCDTNASVLHLPQNNQPCHNHNNRCEYPNARYRILIIAVYHHQ